MINAINSSKSKDLSNLLFALGIRQIGKKASKNIASHFKNIDNIMNATTEEFTDIFDVGEISGKNVVEFFNNPDNRKIIEELKEYGVNMEYISTDVSEVFKNMTFVLTGTLPTLSRADATKIIEDNGGKASSSVSKKTTYVLAGEDAGSKLTKAQNLGIKIITEDEFLEMVKN